MGPVYRDREDGLSNFDVLYCSNESVGLSLGVKTKNKDYGTQNFTAAK